MLVSFYAHASVTLLAKKSKLKMIAVQNNDINALIFIKKNYNVPLV